MTSIITTLTEAIDILTADVPDMDVSEWNATPSGRAVRKIEAAIEALVDEGVE